MPGHKREAQDQLPKTVKEMELEFEDPWDDEFSDASLEYEEIQDDEMQDYDEENQKGNILYLNKRRFNGLPSWTEVG